jgi:hypothetical protein
MRARVARGDAHPAATGGDHDTSASAVGPGARWAV